MNRPTQLNDTIVKTNSKILWFGLLSSPLIFGVMVYFMDKLAVLEPVLPDLNNIFIGLCIISIASPFILLGYFKRIQNTVRDNIQLGMDNSPEDLQRYLMFLIIGMSLCNLSGVFGLVLYILAGNLKYSLFFIAVSFCLGFLYQPELK